MMKMEIAEDFSASNDQTIVKGKRTKRQRPSSSAAEISTTTSSEISTNTEEDEDMANCLILLARGSSPPPAAAAENKFSSRKFTQMGTTTNAKVGIYVYECKTCNRTFPSFQALGGHRASHKKPKSTTDNDRKNSPPSPPAAATEEEKAQLTIPAITQLQNKSCQNDPNKAKIHDCTICGSEFASGQALGGHMRRHRPATSTTNGTRLIGASNHNDTMPYDVGEKKPMLTLDLNLPAPAEDDKFHQFPTKQPPQLVFSAAALVDCHN